MTVIKLFVTALVLFNYLGASYAQVGINTTNPSTSLEIVGANNGGQVTATDGLLVPRVNDTDMSTATAGTSDGQMVYNTADKQFYSWNASTNAWVSTNERYQVGDFAQGGIIFWVDESGKHGLVVAKNDQSTGLRWHAGTDGVTLARGDGPFAGEANNSIIIAAQIAIGSDTNPYAARLCNELQITENGITYGDWYLPSLVELNLIYQNKSIVDAIAIANGGNALDNSRYWSSTEFNNISAYRINFNNGGQNNDPKSAQYHVRAIRAF